MFGNSPRWSFFYIFSVFIFMYHACVGWKKAPYFSERLLVIVYTRTQNRPSFSFFRVEVPL